MLIPLIIADILMVFFYLWKAPVLPPEIPLYFSRPWGDEQLAPTYMLLVIPLLMNVFFIINRLVVRTFFKGDRVMYRIIQIANAVTIVIFTTAFIHIIRLVT